MKRRNLPFGDPYGNRTRVSAVERNSPVDSTAVAPLAVETGVRDSNALVGAGQNLAHLITYASDVWWFSPRCVSGSVPAVVSDATKQRIARGLAVHFGGVAA